MNLQRIQSYLTADIAYHGDILMLRKLVLINALTLVICALFFGFALFNWHVGELGLALVDSAGLVLCGFAYYQLHHHKRWQLTIDISSLCMLFFLWALAYVGKNQSFSLIWTLFFPLFIFMLQGRHRGTMMVVVFYAVLLPMAYVEIAQWQQGQWQFGSFLRFSCASLVMSLACYLSELAMEKSYESYQAARAQRRQLRQERNALLLETIEKQDKLLTDVSHELRTPLTVMRIQLESLQDGMADPERTYQSLQAKIGELDKFIHDLSKTSSSGRQQLAAFCQPTNVAELVASVLGHYTPIALECGLTLEVQGNLPTLPIALNSENIHIALSKIIDNALRYTAAPGKVQVLLATEPQALTITVQDSAPGVLPEQHAKLFEQLYRTEQSRNRATGGSGLGLAVAKSVIEAHQGSINATPSPLGGLAVTVRLPFKIPT